MAFEAKKPKIMDSDDDDDELITQDDSAAALALEQQMQPSPSISIAKQIELASGIFDDDDDPSLEHLHCLKYNFKHDQFRPKQWEII